MIEVIAELKGIIALGMILLFFAYVVWVGMEK